MQVEPRVIPVLLIADGRFVKTRRFSDPVYVGDPVNVLSIFNEFAIGESLCISAEIVPGEIEVVHAIVCRGILVLDVFCSLSASSESHEFF